MSRRLAAHEMLDRLSGAATYWAPEMIEGSHNHMVDYWCLGISTYNMLSGAFPFSEQPDLKTEEREDKIQDCILNDNIPNLNEKRALIGHQYEKVSDNGCNFILSLLKKDHNERLGSRNRKQDIRQHSFFKGLEWDKLENGELIPPFKPDVITILFFY